MDKFAGDEKAGSKAWVGEWYVRWFNNKHGRALPLETDAERSPVDALFVVEGLN